MNSISTTSPEHLVRISGHMCIYSALEQKRELLNSLQDTASLVLDLGEVDEMDSAGYQLLWLLNREAVSHGKVLTLLNCSPAVDEVLHFFDAVDLLDRCVTREPGVGNAEQGQSHD